MLEQERGARCSRCTTRPRRCTTSRCAQSLRRGRARACARRCDARSAIGCSGWNYAHWRGGRVYPEGCPPSRWLPTYAQWFDTVEVNATFYRLTKPHIVERWIEQTPADFVFAVKGSRYLTHMKRLQDRERGLDRFYAAIEPLVGRRSSARCCGSCRRTSAATTSACTPWLEALPDPAATRWSSATSRGSSNPMLELLRAHGVALVIGPTAPPPQAALRSTPPPTSRFVRFHYGARGRRGNYSERELEEWAQRIRALASDVDVFAYFNNDWEGFAVENGKRLRQLVRSTRGVPR